MPVEGLSDNLSAVEAAGPLSDLFAHRIIAGQHRSETMVSAFAGNGLDSDGHFLINTQLLDRTEADFARLNIVRGSRRGNRFDSLAELHRNVDVLAWAGTTVLDTNEVRHFVVDR